jgi:isoleucyl-tRNA synthetase
VQLCKVAAPYTPFIAEEIYLNLKGKDDPQSVHLCDFPKPRAGARDLPLERMMENVRAVVSLGRQLRTEKDLKVRQPLNNVHVVCSDADTLESLRGGVDMIKDELNVKNVKFGSDETTLADISLKADFRKLGPKFGAKMKAAAAAIKAVGPEEAAVFLKTGTLDLGDGMSISSDEVSIVRTPKAGLAVASEGSFVTALDTELTPELVAEGLAREFTSHVQSLRKEAGLDVEDNIDIIFEADGEITSAVNTFSDYIKTETLAKSITAASCSGTETSLNGHQAKISVAKA